MKKQEVPFCDGCGKVRDEIQPETNQNPWGECRAYEMKYGFKWDDLVLTHTLCPECQSVSEAALKKSDQH